MPPALFVTGTDTGVGKTRIAARMIETLRASGIRAVGYKPVLSGPDRSDAEILWRASGGESDENAQTVDEVNPVWLNIPAAPLSARLAGESEAGRIDRCLLIDRFEALAMRFDFVVIEGTGGWEVPIDETTTFADLAKSFGAPVVVVAANRLGVLNHTLLTVEAIRRRDLECVGVILNEIAAPDPDDLARQTNLETLRLCLDRPVEPGDWNATGPFPSEILSRFGIETPSVNG
ncbi:MAG: dethiobiotin synthase [Verrucomicrobiae bacterium]|nr:dethiobiotin synthase [Verrucomicrobiae bacterium]